MSDGVAAGRPAEPLQQPADDPRQTRIGRILRRTHLDELPQLVTGAWQLYRSPDRPVDELVQLDQGYLAQWSPRSDLRLLATTMLHVLRR
jgi:lipopolysaccharide/colanic/teichoic acid biosynthesis glycosyltransferase